MSTISPPLEAAPKFDQSPGREVLLADGQSQSLDGLTGDQLHELQWHQEQLFALAILQSPKASKERSLATAQAYDTICSLLAAQRIEGQPLIMGMDARYVRLVLEILDRQVKQGMGQPRFFEIGYGCGEMLRQVRDRGFLVGGVEVSTAMRDKALGTLGERCADQLLLGDLRDVDPKSFSTKPSLVYWNDVFEHVCPDEIEDYLAHIYKMLAPGGSLVTITPNWLLRPSDVTGDFCPPRTEARGLHLKEYRLAEVSWLLRRAGFRSVATPLVVSKRRIYLAGNGLRWVKQLAEPLIDHLPWRVAHLLCRGLGLSCTIATK
ncbi:MAG: methyltransferase domain-containing protein [Planctomycetales bacterium]|nr:methyltransferase domain-containing protein [Planctomycetales bacterium]